MLRRAACASLLRLRPSVLPSSSTLVRGSRQQARAQQQEQPPASGTSTSAPARPATMPAPRPGRPVAPPGTIMGPDGQPLKVVPIEKAGDEAWAGVAAVDSGDSATSLSTTFALAAGDVVALLLFAAAGRANHGEGSGAGEVLFTALPFIVGWFTAAPLLGGFGAASQGGDVKAAAGAAARCWAVATPLGLVLRGLSKGYVPPTPFIIVATAATGVLLIGWRSAFAFANGMRKGPQVPQTAAAKLASRKDKQGGPLEFMQLLASLVKRW